MTDFASLVRALEVAELDTEGPILASLSALALADPDTFLANLLAIPDGSTRGDVIEAITVPESFPRSLETMVIRYLEAVLAELAGLSNARTQAAPDAAMALYPLGDLVPPKITETFADTLYDRVAPALAHPHPDVRLTLVELVACFGRATRVGSREPVVRVLEGDPDPLVRAIAYRSLAEANALPQGAKRPWSPHAFRALRRSLAGR